MMFIDKAKIYLKAGNGGDGCVSFRKEKHVPMGGPDGGDGGKGGNIVVRVNKNLITLIDMRYNPHYRSARGGHGRGKNQHGKNGEELLIEVPPGTIVRDYITGEEIADLVGDKELVVLAFGGQGGKGNSSFKTSVHKAPRYAQKGRKGQERTVELDLKLIADVCLIGCPNAGKSTFLSKVSNANPKIADYPFTTLNPNLGVVKISEGRSFVIADIPGLITGAHEGKGLGDEFLRHIERTKVLIHVVDIFGFESDDALENFQNINRELESYNPALTKKIQFVAINKIDLPDGHEKYKELIKSIAKYKVFPVSALTGEGLDKLLFSVAEVLNVQEE